MVIAAMVVILAPAVKLLLTLVTRILNQPRKVDGFHMYSNMRLLWAHVSTNVALKLSQVNSFTNLFNVVVQVKLLSLFLTENLIACKLVHLLNRGLGGVHQLTGIQLPLDMHSSISIVVLRDWCRPLLFNLWEGFETNLSWRLSWRRCSSRCLYSSFWKPNRKIKI